MTELLNAIDRASSDIYQQSTDWFIALISGSAAPFCFLFALLFFTLYVKWHHYQLQPPFG